MTAKQEFQTIINMLSEEDITYALQLVKDNFALRRKGIAWDDIEEVDPDDEDFALMEKIRSREDGYGEYVKQDELLKKIMHN